MCKFVLISLLIVTVFVLLLQIIAHPKVVTFHVTNATLTEFDYTNKALHHNLALNITVHNPNKWVGIYYDYVEADAFYQDVKFDSQTLGTFFQHHDNISVLSPVFKGVMPLSTDRISKLNMEKSFGIYHIDMKLYLNVRFKLGLIKTWKVQPKVLCDFLVHLKSRNGTTLANEFQDKKCEYNYIKMWYH